jgi:hypothetical protein
MSLQQGHIVALRWLFMMLRQLTDHCCLAGWMACKAQLPSCQALLIGTKNLMASVRTDCHPLYCSGSAGAGGWPAQQQKLSRTANSEPHSQVQQQQQCLQYICISHQHYRSSKAQVAGQRTPDLRRQWEKFLQCASCRQPQLHHSECFSTLQHVRNAFTLLIPPLQQQQQQQQQAQFCPTPGHRATRLNSLPTLQQQLQQRVDGRRCMSTDTKLWKKQQQQQQQGGNSSGGSSSRGASSKKPQLRRNHQITARHLTVVFPDGTSQVQLLWCDTTGHRAGVNEQGVEAREGVGVTVTVPDGMCI